MTLADFVRRYLEERRRICEEKARFSGLGHDVSFFSKESENTSSSDTSGKKYFSNTLEKKPKDDTCVTCTKNQIQKNIRIIRRPDGRLETETTVKDADGNVEKTVTYQEGDKTYTTVTRTDSKGNKQVKHKIGQVAVFSENPDGSTVQLPVRAESSRNSDDDYDFWYSKFFGDSKPADEFDDTNDKSMPEFGQDAMPFDFNNIEDNVNRLLKMFENDVPGTFKNQWSPNNDTEKKDWFVEDFTPRLSDEASKFIEQFENGIQKPGSKNKKLGKKDDRDLQSQVDNIMKNFLQMKTPSLFEQFAERAVVEVPEEKTPLDKFIEYDDETKKKRLSILNESSEFMKKLNNFFDRKQSIDEKTDVYSDIDSTNNADDFAIFVPQPTPSPNLNDFSKILAKQFGPFSGVNLNITTSSKMRFPNGNLRTETVKKIENGNYEKSITYEAGNKVYTLITVTSPSGQQIRRQRKLNFSESELSNFKKQWDARYQSDFSD